MSSLPPPRPPERALRRSRDDRVIGGVAGGLGRYLGIDPVVVRIVFVVLVLFGGSGVIAYLIGWLVIPEEPADGQARARGIDGSGSTDGSTDGGTDGGTAGTGSVVLGVLLVTVGGMLLLDRLVPGFRTVLGPLLLIALGVLVLWRVRR